MTPLNLVKCYWCRRPDTNVMLITMLILNRSQVPTTLNNFLTFPWLFQVTKCFSRIILTAFYMQLPHSRRKYIFILYQVVRKLLNLVLKLTTSQIAKTMQYNEGSVWRQCVRVGLNAQSTSTAHCGVWRCHSRKKLIAFPHLIWRNLVKFVKQFH